MSHETILITGATGFIGEHTLNHFAESDRFQPRALVRDEKKARQLRDRGIEVFVGDVTKPETIAGATDNCYGVIHLAGDRTHIVRSDEAFKVNVEGTRNVLDSAIRSGVSRIVYPSSIAVYGSNASGTIYEDRARIGSDDYAESKIQAEELLLQEVKRRSIEAVILRLGQVYGSGARGWRTGFLRRPAVIGEGRGILNLSYVSNTVDAFELALTKEGINGEVFNIADGGFSWKELMGLYKEMTGKNIWSIPPWMFNGMLFLWERLARSVNVYSPDRIRFMTSTGVLDTTKAKEILGWKPKLDLNRGMRKTEEALRKHPKYSRYLKD